MLRAARSSLTEANVTYPARANKTELLRLLTLHREGAYLEFMEAVKRAGAMRTLESLARIEAGAQGGALVERVTTTRTTKDGAITTTVRERWTPPDWHADGWFLERRHPADWSRRTELVASTPYSGTLNHPAPHVPAQPRGIGHRYGARLTPLERDATRWCKHDSRHVASVPAQPRGIGHRYGARLTPLERDATRWCKHDSRHVASVLMLRRMGWRRHGRSLTSIRLELSLCPACLRLSAFGCVDHRLGQPSGYGEGVDGVFEGLWVSGAGQAVGVGFA